MSQPVVEPNCPFCLDNKLFEGEILARTPAAYLVANSFSPGNYLVIPTAHIEDPLQLPDDWWGAVKELLPQIADFPADYNLSLNLGRHAGQSVKHLHFWFIPRPAGHPASGRGLAGFIDDATKE
jgi:diadenosine tetraphosphate (Ap4A) HIT family hydrolase